MPPATPENTAGSRYRRASQLALASRSEPPPTRPTSRHRPPTLPDTPDARSPSGLSNPWLAEPAGSAVSWLVGEVCSVTVAPPVREVRHREPGHAVCEQALTPAARQHERCVLRVGAAILSVRNDFREDCATALPLM